MFGQDNLRYPGGLHGMSRRPTKIMDIRESIPHQDTASVVGSLTRCTADNQVFILRKFIQVITQVIERDVDRRRRKRTFLCNLTWIADVQNNRIWIIH
jgi:hypothetical protein